MYYAHIPAVARKRDDRREALARMPELIKDG